MKYIARKPFRYGTGVYLTGQEVTINDPDDVRMLQGQGKIGGQVRGIRPAVPRRETATIKPPENAVMPPPVEKQKDYENMTKNEIVRELNLRGIEHNKRQVKAELIALLRGD